MLPAGIAQLVEHQLPKLRVAGSSPVSRSPWSFGAVSSVGLERLPYKQKVGGSNPSPPTSGISKGLLCRKPPFYAANHALFYGQDQTCDSFIFKDSARLARRHPKKA